MQQNKRLRKTDEFLEDLQMKHRMVNDLIGVIQQLQDHLSTQHQAISDQKFSCSNCEQYTMKQDLVQKELTLLHHELKRMIQSKQRISISGIPAERIYNLATRTYSVCEEHREMHMQSRNRHSFCQHPEDSSDTDDSEIIQGSLLVNKFGEDHYFNNNNEERSDNNDDNNNNNNNNSRLFTKYNN